MQNIKVKEINSKSGTNKKGQWTSFIVVAEDGAEFTSFDTKLSGVKSGSILVSSWKLRANTRILRNGNWLANLRQQN